MDRSLADDLAERFEGAAAHADAAATRVTRREWGRVEHVGDGVASLSGLPGARLDELLHLPGERRAMVVALEPERVGAVMLDPAEDIAAGERVLGSGDVVRTPVGEALLGRIVDPLGRPLDQGPPVAAGDYWPVERPAPAIIERGAVAESLHTGTLVVDAMLPVGRGQRELILGDRNTGKTTLAVDAILAQRDSDVVCVYAAIGQRGAGIRRVVERVREHGDFGRCVFVVAEADAPAGLQWIAPYAACSVAEWFRDRGGHALLVLDDLTRHASVHRQISLLLRHPPGREAYPGDVFYLHSRLLERAARLADERGGGSLTALPIAETQAGNLSAYIPTNLVSITDGQVVLDARLFAQGQKPAVDVGRSVSRVGAVTQPPALRALAGNLRLDYAQFLELESFARFGQVADEGTRQRLEHGRRMRELLRQLPARPQPAGLQVALLTALGEGMLDALPRERVADFRTRAQAAMAADPGLLDVAGRSHEDGAARARLRDWLDERLRETDVAHA